MNIIVKMHDRVRVIETTRMDLHSGIMLEDDFLDISDYLNQGVLLERSVFISHSIATGGLDFQAAGFGAGIGLRAVSRSIRGGLG